MITAAWILGQDLNPENGLIDIIKTHLKRIDKTLSYAIAQQNNHAISEAAALFIGGSFLLNLDKRAEAWTFKGRRLLEDHISNLIESDGTFSQYSLNYHRFMLDTCSLVEAWRSHKGLEFFSENFIIDEPFTLINFNVEGANRESNLEIINTKIKYKNKIFEFSSQGNGPISAFVNGIRENFDLQFTLEDFGQNTRSATSKAEAAAYVELKIENGQRSIFGCGINTSITLAPILAVISALNKFKD